MFTLFGSPSARMQKQATKLIGGEAMSVLKKMLEKNGKLGFLGVLIFLIVECGVQVQTVEAGRNTKIIIKDTSKLRRALDRKLAEDNAKLDEKLERNRKIREKNKKIREQNKRKMMEILRKAKKRQDAERR